MRLDDWILYTFVCVSCVIIIGKRIAYSSFCICTLRPLPPIAGCFFFCVFVLSMLHLLHYIVWNIYLTSQEVDFSMMFPCIFFQSSCLKKQQNMKRCQSKSSESEPMSPLEKGAMFPSKKTSKQTCFRGKLAVSFRGWHVGFLPYLFYHSGREHFRPIIQAILSQLFKCPIRNLKSLSEDVWWGTRDPFI